MTTQKKRLYNAIYNLLNEPQGNSQKIQKYFLNNISKSLMGFLSGRGEVNLLVSTMPETLTKRAIQTGKQALKKYQSSLRMMIS